MQQRPQDHADVALLTRAHVAQRRELHEALLDGGGFEDLPGKWQAAIVMAEQNRPKARTGSGARSRPAVRHRGTPPEVMQDMGHTDPELALAIYAHACAATTARTTACGRL